MSISKFSTAAATVALATAVFVGSGIAAQELDDYGDSLPQGARGRRGVARIGTES